MGVDYYICKYCHEVDSEHKISHCDTCYRNVCHSVPCFVGLPKLVYDNGTSICGYCQLKKRLNNDVREQFKQYENDILQEIGTLNVKRFYHYKRLIEGTIWTLTCTKRIHKNEN